MIASELHSTTQTHKRKTWTRPHAHTQRTTNATHAAASCTYLYRVTPGVRQRQTVEAWDGGGGGRYEEGGAQGVGRKSRGEDTRFQRFRAADADFNLLKKNILRTGERDRE